MIDDILLGNYFTSSIPPKPRTPEQMRDSIVKMAKELAKDLDDQRKPIMVVCGNGDMYDIRKWEMLCSLLDEVFHPKEFKQLYMNQQIKEN